MNCQKCGSIPLSSIILKHMENRGMVKHGYIKIKVTRLQIHSKNKTIEYVKKWLACAASPMFVYIDGSPRNIVSYRRYGHSNVGGPCIGRTAQQYQRNLVWFTLTQYWDQLMKLYSLTSWTTNRLAGWVCGIRDGLRSLPQDSSSKGSCQYYTLHPLNACSVCGKQM